MRPVIGILTEIDDKLVTKAHPLYVAAIEGAGGVPVVLPYANSDETVARFISLCDGFLFAGGADIDPRRYGEEAKATCGAIQPHRDGHDLRVLNGALEREKPILAICRGAQLVNVALGGTLYQDIPSERPSPIPHNQQQELLAPSHDVEIIKGTPLHALIGTESMHANSFHHQAIKRLGKGLAVMAQAPDGIVEAVFFTGKQYIRAYQWHPERLFASDLQNRRIFADFIRACDTETPFNRFP